MVVSSWHHVDVFVFSVAHPAAYEAGRLLGFLIIFGGLGLAIAGIIDASGHPDWAWKSAGHNKTLWLVLNAVDLLLSFVLVGLVIGLVYMLAIRPTVAKAQKQGQSAGPGTGGFGNPYGGAGPYNGAGQYGGGPYGGGGAGQYGGGAGQYGGGAGGQYGATPTPGGFAGPSGGQAPALPPAGWYPDPTNAGQNRYWDGHAWT
jgi:Protein of unknown function (DUF2510)